MVQLYIREIQEVCEAAGLNRGKKEKKTEGLSPEEFLKERKERLQKRHYSHLDAETVRKKLDSVEKNLRVGSGDKTRLSERRALYAKILEAMEQGDLMEAVRQEELKDYQSELVTEYILLQAEKEECPEEELLLELSPESYNIFTYEQIRKIIQEGMKGSSESDSAELFSKEYTDSLTGLYAGRNKEAYEKLIGEIRRKNNGEHIWEKENFRRMTEYIAAVWTDKDKEHKLRPQEYAQDPDWIVLDALHRELIPMLEKDALTRKGNYRKASLILLENPAIAETLAKRNLTNELNLDDEEKVSIIFRNIQKKIKADRREVEDMIGTVAPYLNIRLPKKKQQDTAPVNFSMIIEYMRDRGRKYKNPIRSALNDARRNLSGKADLQEARKLLSETEGDLEVWKGSQSVIRSCYTEEVDRHFPDFQNMVEEEERELQKLEAEYGELRGILQKREKELAARVSVLNQKQNEFMGGCQRLQELNDDLDQNRKRKRSREWIEEQKAFLGELQAEYGQILQMIDSIENEYGMEEEFQRIKETNQVSSQNMKVVAFKIQTAQEQLKRSRQRKIWLVIFLIFLAFSTGGTVLQEFYDRKKAGDQYKEALEILEENDTEAFAELAETLYSEEYAAYREELGGYICGSELKDSIQIVSVGETEDSSEEKRTSFTYTFDNGVINAEGEAVLVQEGEAITAEAGPARINGIDLIGQWVWEQGCDLSSQIVAVTFDSYDDAAGTVTGTIMLDTTNGEATQPVTGVLDKEAGTLSFEFEGDLQVFFAECKAQRFVCSFDPVRQTLVDESGYAWTRCE